MEIKINDSKVLIKDGLETISNNVVDKINIESKELKKYCQKRNMISRWKRRR